MRVRPLLLLAVLLSSLVLAAPIVLAQCPEEPRLDSYVGAGRVTCPCFVANEEAGAVFDLPAEVFPIEILRVGVGWGSQLGGQPNTLEDSIRIYAAGLPDPGSPVFTMSGPELVDGVINEFNLEPFPGEIIIESSPFTVTLRFLNGNSGNPFLPSTVHDGTVCQAGKNVVYAVPGGWMDGCTLGITGQWVFHVVYRKVNCTDGRGSVPDGKSVPGNPLTVEHASADRITLTWDASCESTDDDYEVYEGIASHYYTHDLRFCSTGGATTATFLPGTGNTYYLVVPGDSSGEGSYGRDSLGNERPPGGLACTTQEPISCP